MPATEPDDTLDQAQSLGDLSVAPRAEAVGTIGDGAAGPADVDWYSFQLDRAANVTLSSPPSQAGAPSITTLSLYGSDPNDPNDPYDPLGYNLIDQSDSADLAGGARIDQRLAAGTYYVAVSGSGNHYIYPFLAGSGGVGATGDYGLLLTAADLGLGPNDGPAVLTSDPQPGAALDRSPFLIRIDMSEPLNAQTVSAGTTVQLLSNATGTFGDGTDQVVALANASLNPAGTKLLIAPAAPLTPSYYKVVLAGNSMANSQVLTDQSGNALGATSDNSTGADFSYTFHVLSNEGNAAGSSAADDTPATAHQLGDISNLPLRQISGAIGDDSSDPIAFDPADVNLYHFQINESGQHAFIAEVFAGRIGSPLFPALSLFRADGNGQLTLQASNAGTMNGTAATNGQVPLFNDPVLYAGLTQGDYYLAVSGMGNVSDPIAGPAPGTNGVFDPTISHSGQAGFTTGPYLLNLHVHSDNTPPQVITTTPQEGDALTAPPTDLLVQFSEPINLQQAAYFESQQTGQNNLDAVYLQGSDGTKYYPRLISYDGSTQQAHFQLLDGLPNGTYQLHLSNSGPYGLTDLAGNPLAGNDPSGDYVVHFSVQGPTRGSNGNPLQWYDQEPNDSVNQPQDLGVLFPHELQSGVTITRDPSLDPGTTYADSADYYRFQVLQSRDYIVSLSGTGLPNGTLPTFTDASGNSVPTLSQGTGGGVRVTLDAGTYVMGVGGWDPSTASTVAYQLQISLAAAAENPIPLTIGPAPAYRIALAVNQSAPPPVSPTNTPAPPAPTPPPSSPPAPPTPPTGPSNSTPPSPSPSTPTPSTTPPNAPSTSTPPVPSPSTPPAQAGEGSQSSTPPTTPANTPPSAPPASTVAPPTPAANTPPPAPLASPVATSPISDTPSPSPVQPAATVATPPATLAAPPATPANALPAAVPAAPSVPPPLSVVATPSTAAGAPPHLDISVPVEAINTSGVLLIANYRVGGETSSFTAIPSEVLQSLSALPVGGVRGTNRGDFQVSSDRFSVRNTDPQVRLMTLNQTSTRSDSDPDPQRTTPTDQTPSTLSRTGKPAADAGRPSASALTTLFKTFTSNLEGVWRGALDNLFMDGPWQGRLNEWLERLPVAPSTSLDEGIGLEGVIEGQESFDTTSLNSFSDDASGSAAPGWAYAGLLLGVGAVVGKDMKKRNSRTAAGSPWDR